MKIFLTGATGYIGKRLLIQLLSSGHEVICSVRDQKRFDLSLYENYKNQLTVITHDYNDVSTLSPIDHDIEIAF